MAHWLDVVLGTNKKPCKKPRKTKTPKVHKTYGVIAPGEFPTGSFGAYNKRTKKAKKVRQIPKNAFNGKRSERRFKDFQTSVGNTVIRHRTPDFEVIERNVLGEGIGRNYREIKSSTTAKVSKAQKNFINTIGARVEIW